MITLDEIDLPSSLTWTDRDNWQPVANTLRRARDGTPVIYYANQLGGRPITLASTESSGWITRQTIDQLQAFAAVPGGMHTLTIGDESFTVIWRHNNPPAISAEPLVARTTHEPGDFFLVVLKLMTA
jgi:hypothetical protein